MDEREQSSINRPSHFVALTRMNSFDVKAVHERWAPFIIEAAAAGCLTCFGVRVRGLTYTRNAMAAASLPARDITVVT